MGAIDYLLMAVLHPSELRAIINYGIWRDASRDITNPSEFATSHYDQPDMRKCWDLLDLTSRSFSMVIKELEGDLARTVAIFYLILRALDTVEDDMTLPNSVKLPLLRSFYTKLDEPGWTFNDSGPNEKDRQVLVDFNCVQAEFSKLKPGYQNVIQDIARKMGAGMADFAALATPELPVAEVNSIADYDLYCHYVAGLVGEGLSGLFAASGKERAFIRDQLTLSNSMGLLLQKTNILRDIKEDVDEGRGFWPRAIWGKHGFDSMKELIDPRREKEAMFAASEMTLDALRHATDALDYLTLIKCQSVFNFVAIPAIMAIATLDRCFMNPKILRGNVKIRKGEAVQLILKAVNPRDVSYAFRDYTRSIHSKVHRDDPNLLKISIACGKVEQWTEHHYPSFLSIRPNPNGGVQTVIDPASNDARAILFNNLAKIESEKAATAKRAKWLEDMKAKGIIKTLTPEEEAKREIEMKNRMEEPVPWLMIASVVIGVLAVMAALGGGITWIILKYAD